MMEKMDGVHFYLVLFNLKFKVDIPLYLKIDTKLYSFIVDKYKCTCIFILLLLCFFNMF